MTMGSDDKERTGQTGNGPSAQVGRLLSWKVSLSRSLTSQTTVGDGRGTGKLIT